jgi:hypothetical protein
MPSTAAPLRHSSVTPFLCCMRVGGATLDSPVPPPSPPVWFISRPFTQCERFATSHLLLAISLLPIFQLQPFSFPFSFLIPRSLPSIYPGLVSLQASKPFSGEQFASWGSRDLRNKITIPQASDDIHKDQRITCGEWGFKSPSTARKRREECQITK